MDSECWHTAHSLANLGIKVFPVKYGEKTPFYPENWCELATSNPTMLGRLLPRTRQFGLAAVLGPESGIMDIELDNEEAKANFENLIAVYGEPPTVAYRSARGIHRWFTWDRELAEIHSKAVSKVFGIEMRFGLSNKGAYSVIPPSLHETKALMYEWLPGRSPWECPISPLPEGIRRVFKLALEQKARTGKSSVTDVTILGDDFLPTEGHRHEYMLRLSHMLAGSLRLPRPLVVSMMREFSSYTGAYGDREGPDGGEKEIRDMISTVQRLDLPEESMASIDFTEAYEDAKLMLEKTRIKESETLPHLLEIPAELFDERTEGISRCAHASQLPRNFFLMSLFGAISSSIGGSVTAQASIDHPATGLQTYQLGVGSSGSGKSRVINFMMAPLSSADNFVTDATSESLRSGIFRNPRGVLLKVVEGKQFTRMLGRYQGQVTENSILLEAWSGDTIAVTRQDEKKSFRIESPFLTVVAAIQPHNLNAMSTEDIMEGIMQRLYIYEGDKVPKDADASAQRELNKWYETEYKPILSRLQELRPFVYKTEIEMMEGVQDLTTRPIKAVLNLEAEAVWRGYARWKKSDDVLGQFTDDHPFQNDLLRHAEKALRSAVILYLFHLAGKQERWEDAQINVHDNIWIPAWAVKKGVLLEEWAWRQKLDLMGVIAEDRYRKAMPPQTLKEKESLGEAVFTFAVNRCRVLKTRLKGSEEWSSREYYRAMRLSSDRADHELRILLDEKLLEVAGNRDRTTTYRFVEKVRMTGNESQSVTSTPESVQTNN